MASHRFSQAHSSNARLLAKLSFHFVDQRIWGEKGQVTQSTQMANNSSSVFPEVSYSLPFLANSLKLTFLSALNQLLRLDFSVGQFGAYLA